MVKRKADWLSHVTFSIFGFHLTVAWLVSACSVWA